jgi:hypothetical protein
METASVNISVKGKLVEVPAIHIEGHIVVSMGRWLRVASVFDEDWETRSVEDPRSFVTKLREQSRSDIFTFAQKLPATKPVFDYPFVWDNVAAVPITTYTEWWEGLPQATRRNVRIAEKKNVSTRIVPFDDTLVRGIKGIYDESATRQGKRFWHYGKDHETVKRENSTYAHRADFIGAFLGEELIGFLKIVYVGKVGSIMQILSLSRHVDKKPTNTLIAKAVETCAQKGMSHFVYCQYVYGNNTSSPLTEFKRRNGFEQILLPRYYIPLTAKGRLALKLNAHLGIRRLIPKRVEGALRSLRARWHEKAARKPGTEQSEASAA